MHVCTSGTLCHHIQTDSCSTVPILPLSYPPLQTLVSYLLELPNSQLHLNFHFSLFPNSISGYKEYMFIVVEVSGLYIVQITWLWGLSSLQQNHRFFRYTGIPTAARQWGTFCSKIHTVTYCYTHYLGRITGCNKHINKI